MAVDVVVAVAVAVIPAVTVAALVTGNDAVILVDTPWTASREECPGVPGVPAARPPAADGAPQPTAKNSRPGQRRAHHRACRRAATALPWSPSPPLAPCSLPD